MNGDRAVGFGQLGRPFKMFELCLGCLEILSQLGESVKCVGMTTERFRPHPPQQTPGQSPECGESPHP